MIYFIQKSGHSSSMVIHIFPKDISGMDIGHLIMIVLMQDTKNKQLHLIDGWQRVRMFGEVVLISQPLRKNLFNVSQYATLTIKFEG